MPQCQLRKIITRKRFLEQKMRFKREPWGSKAVNGQYFIMLEMMRKMVAINYQGFGPEILEKYSYSKTTECRDEIEDLRLDPDANEFEFSPDGKEMQNYQNMFASMKAKWG